MRIVRTGLVGPAQTSLPAAGGGGEEEKVAVVRERMEGVDGGGVGGEGAGGGGAGSGTSRFDGLVSGISLREARDAIVASGGLARTRGEVEQEWYGLGES